MERQDVIDLFGYWKSAGLKPPVSATSVEGQEAMVKSFLEQYRDVDKAAAVYLRNNLCRLQYWPRFYDVDEALANFRRERAAEAAKPITQSSPANVRKCAKLWAWTLWKLRQGREIGKYRPKHDEIVRYGQHLGLYGEDLKKNYKLLEVVLNDSNYAVAVGDEDIGYKVYLNPDKEVCFSVTTAVGFEPNKMIRVDFDPLKANPKLAKLL